MRLLPYANSNSGEPDLWPTFLTRVWGRAPATKAYLGPRKLVLWLFFADRHMKPNRQCMLSFRFLLRCRHAAGLYKTYKKSKF